MIFQKPFSILRKCTSDYDTKIHEAFIINQKVQTQIQSAALRKWFFVLVKKYFDSVVFDHSFVNLAGQ